MSTQRIYQLLIALCLVTAIAFFSERSRVLASVLTVVPVNITIALWFIYTGSQGDPIISADFLRMVLLGLLPTALFILACWVGINQGWPLVRVMAVAYAVWLVSMALYRIIDSHASPG
jgi:hypothetical protein